MVLILIFLVFSVVDYLFMFPHHLHFFCELPVDIPCLFYDLFFQTFSTLFRLLTLSQQRKQRKPPASKSTKKSKLSWKLPQFSTVKLIKLS